jgi:hypothetical protein
MSSSNVTGKEPVLIYNYSLTDGLNLVYKDDTSVTVTSGKTTENSLAFELIYPVSTVVSFNDSGLNGLDAGTIAGNKIYYLFAIGDSSQVNPNGFLLSLSLTAPVFPAGYDLYKRIGQVATDIVSFQNVIVPFEQSGNSSVKTYYYNQSGIQVLVGGVDITFTSVDVSMAVPAVDFVETTFEGQFDAEDAELANVRASGSGSSTGIVFTADEYKSFSLITGSDAQIYYKGVLGEGTGLALSVYGYKDFI